MSDEDAADPVEDFRGLLQKLFLQARRPPYRALGTHADHEGRALRPATISNLLNGPTRPRWETVEAFVRACARYARTHQIALTPDGVDLNRWRTDYEGMENALTGRAVDGGRPAGNPVRGRGRQRVIPAQLPPDLAEFTGRATHLGELDGLIADEGGRPAAVAMFAIDGTAGVGKTALAVHWAHQISDRFPDGQLYVNLRGFDPTGHVVDSAEAVRGFLDALGVPADGVPPHPDAQAALYRSLLAGARVLVVLDNARDTDQVRPLLPGAATCLVLITSRNYLAGLITAGAHPIRLDVLDGEESHRLLARRLGPQRVAAEPDAAEGIVTACARLPLALAIAAARARQSGFPLAALSADLAEAAGRLDTLDTGETSTALRTVFSWSYAALGPTTGRLFRLLGLHPGPDISIPAAASLAALPSARTRACLAELTRANLLFESTPGRYTFHDLLRAYAAELAEAEETDPHRRAATLRLLDHYTHTTHAAARLTAPGRDPMPLPLNSLEPGTHPECFTSTGQALTWLATEHDVLVAIQRHAADQGQHVHAWQLAWTLRVFLDRRGDWHTLAAAAETALHSARRFGDPGAEAFAHRMLARPDIRLDHHSQARTRLQHALDLYTCAGDSTGQAHTHHDIAALCEREGRLKEALSHTRQSFDLSRAAGNLHGQATALSNMGWLYTRLGEHTQAITGCNQALVLFQQANDRDGEASVWDNLGHAHSHLGHHAKAIEYYQSALAVYLDLGDRFRQATTLAKLGDAHLRAGDPTAAGAAWRQALDILTDLDHPDAERVRAKLDSNVAGAHHGESLDGLALRRADEGCVT